MQNKLNQLIYFLLLTAVNLIYYVAIPFCYDIIDYNLNVVNASESLGCDFISYEAQMIASYMDLTMRDILPCSLIFVFSLLSIITIFRVRRKVHSQTTSRIMRDIRFTFVTLSMNLLFIMMSLPLAIVLFIPGYYSSTSFIVTFYIFYFSYGVNIYVMCLSNSLVRKEVINLFKINVERKRVHILT